MKRGDLVNFYTETAVFASAIKEYVNPGIVLSVKIQGGWFEDDMLVQVMWANGRITNEHVSYLKRVSDETR